MEHLLSSEHQSLRRNERRRGSCCDAAPHQAVRMHARMNRPNISAYSCNLATFQHLGDSIAAAASERSSQADKKRSAGGFEGSELVQGYLIGNGVTDPEIDGNALVNFAYFKSLISTELYTALVAHCNASYWDVQPGVFPPHV